MSSNPGLRNQSAVRNTARIVGVVLLIAALAVGIPAVLDLVHAVNNNFEPDPGGGLVLRLAAGGFLFVFAMAAINTGFLGAQARYVSGEVAPVARDSIDYLSRGRGIANIGRTDAAPATGPFCRECGTRNDDSAKFCDSCGTSLG
jgi:hypothetical protein